jgi:8-oxo-dGTP diphosphatase
MTLPARPVSPGQAEGTLWVRDTPASSPPQGPTIRAVTHAPRGPAPSVLPPVVGEIWCSGSPSPTVTPSLPAVSEFDEDVLRPGEWVRVDGTAGTVTIRGVEEVRVVTAFLEREDGRLLLLRRSDRVGSFQGRWAAVSGFLEDPTPEAQAFREVLEETGIPRSQLTLAAGGRPVLSRDGERVWVVHPFRFKVRSPEVRIDWEHSEFAWVLPEEIRSRSTVPKLGLAWERVAPSVRAKP